MYDGCQDDLFNAGGLWVLTQLPAEQRWDGREIWVKPLWALGVNGVEMESRRAARKWSRVSKFQTGKHIWLSEHDFGSLKYNGHNGHRPDEHSVYMCGETCACVCVPLESWWGRAVFIIISIYSTGWPLDLSSANSIRARVLLHVCVCVRELFVLIRIKGLFQWEEALTLLNPCCLNPAANDLCLFLRSLYFLSHTAHNSPPSRYDNVPKKKEESCDNGL